MSVGIGMCMCMTCIELFIFICDVLLIALSFVCWWSLDQILLGLMTRL